jgi:UDP-GlcNAc:undecaprenyl-phosphate GlcNAc-1-phosphate transferase
MVTIAGALMLPVVDTLRVFYARVARGRSPFSADRNHLHHWLIRHHLLHSQATTRLIVFQALLLACSLLLVQFCSITVVVVLQAVVVAAYSKLLHLSLQFRRWLVFIKRLETAP